MINVEEVLKKTTELYNYKKQGQFNIRHDPVKQLPSAQVIALAEILVAEINSELAKLP